MSCYTSQEQKQPMLIEGNNLTIPKNLLKKKKREKELNLQSQTHYMFIRGRGKLSVIWKCVSYNVYAL